jgi:hypothetical protein
MGGMQSQAKPVAEKAQTMKRDKQDPARMTSFQVEVGLADQFREFCRLRGTKLHHATGTALEQWMLTEESRERQARVWAEKAATLAEMIPDTVAKQGVSGKEY